MEKERATVDVVIPVYKPDERLAQSIRHLLQQTYPVNHIYLMHTIPEQGEIPNLEETYREEVRISVIPVPQSQFNHGGTRNQGVSLSKAEYVLMMTQDAVPKNKNLVQALMEPFADPQVAVSYARQLATKEAGMVEQYTRQFNYPAVSHKKSVKDLQRLGIKTYFCSDVCALYKKEIYEKLGGFVTKTIFAEDMILASQIIQEGYEIAYAAKAQVFHAHRYTGKQQFQRNFDMGVAHREYREIFSKVPSESEGVQLVKQTALYLCRKGRIDQVVSLIWQSGCKFIGYRLGKCYDRLPMWFVRRASSQKSYWKQGKE